MKPERLAGMGGKDQVARDLPAGRERAGDVGESKAATVSGGGVRDNGDRNKVTGGRDLWARGIAMPRS
jgi:hypothetical protein